MEKISTHKDLNIWKKSMDLVEEIYRLTSTFPSSEKYGIISQINRSAISIPANIVEGAARLAICFPLPKGWQIALNHKQSI